MELDGISIIFVIGGLGWEFFDVFGGIGGFVGGFMIINLSIFNFFDVSFNGIMFVNNLDNFFGIWVVKGVVYEDVGDLLNIVCVMIIDLLVIDFLSEESLVIISLVDNEDGFVIVEVSGGMEFYIYFWFDG